MPVRKRDKILVVDLEATCWEKNQTPIGQQNEIIEVGFCVFDVARNTPTEKRSILVKPMRSKVSPFCTKLTSLTQEQVDGGTTFSEACRILQEEYDAKSYLWISWGAFDKRMFKKQCGSFDVPYPFSQNHANLKKVFAQLHHRKKQVGMMRALTMTELEHTGKHHRGDDDAWNIARILAYMIDKNGYDFLDKYW